MRVLSLVLFIFIFLPYTISAQEETSFKKLEKQAKKAFKNEDFKSALPLYSSLYSMDSTNVEVNYRLGVSHFNIGQKDSSIKYLEHVVKERTESEYQNTEYTLARAYHSMHNYDEALKHYQIFLSQLSKGNYDKELAQEVTKCIKNCEVGKVLVKNKVKCIIKNPGNKINSTDDESHPVVSPDGKYVYFSARNREHEDNHKKHSGVDPGDIFSSKDVNGNLSMSFALSFNLHSEFLDAPMHISPDGKRIYYSTITANKSNDIFYSDLLNGEWAKPVALGAPFNSEANETGFTLTEDGTMAFFSSDRPGGYGGQDLYVVRKDENGKWGKEINLGPQINSAYAEKSPFISADGKTLYFSSNGPNSIGGYDLFKVKSTGTAWGTPENLGYPINSADDENSISWYSHGYKAYFSSKRKECRGGEDIFFLQVIDTTISAAKYLTYFYEEKLFEEALSKPDTGKKVKEVIYFDFNASRIAEFSTKRLDRIVLLLNTYPDLKLEIQGYTDNKGTEEANHIVSERRAKNVYNYLIAKGVSSNRLKPVGFSAENPVSTGETDLDLARNRRVEFKVLAPTAQIANNAHTGKYYLVKGSFSSKANAQRLKDKLKTEGIQAVIIEPDDTNKFFRVVVGDASSYEEAQEMLTKLKATHGEGIWLLTF